MRDGYLTLEYVFDGSRLIDAIECENYNPHVRIPRAAHIIGTEAFPYAEPVTVEVPNTVTEIHEMAFPKCGRLREVYIPESVTYIHPNAFWRVSDDFTIKAAKGSYADQYAKNTKFFRDKDATIEKTEDFVIEDHVRITGCHSEKRTVEIPASIRYIEEMDESPIEKIQIPGNVKIIGACAFYNCKNLQEVLIEEGAEFIGEAAFVGGAALKLVSLPASLTYIWDDAFDGFAGEFKVVQGSYAENYVKTYYAHCKITYQES